MNGRMPTIFFGHGNPMNALLQNGYTEGWRDIGGRIPKPKAILTISAQWYVPGVALTGAAPRTIHDFGGFPPELFEFDYPAPGSPQLVARVQELLANEGSEVGIDESWGLDHGTWSVLCHVFRDADVPVVQLSIDETRAAPFHYALGQRLQPLRDEGILIMGSGDIVHNLHTYAWGRHAAQPYDWALRFESRARQLMLDGNHAPLVDYESLGRDAVLSVPTPEHYLPLLYVLGASDKGDPVTFPVEGIDGGSVSMLTVQFG
jgi:4,5-DOPA dioxygenase extradiol